MGRREALVVLLAVVLAAAAAGEADAAKAKGKAKGKYRALFNFGDSLADAGNLIANGVPDILATARLPYGQTYFGKPTGRCSDGRLVIDHLAQEFGLPLLPPSLPSSPLLPPLSHPSPPPPSPPPPSPAPPSPAPPSPAPPSPAPPSRPEVSRSLPPPFPSKRARQTPARPSARPQALWGRHCGWRPNGWTG